MTDTQLPKTYKAAVYDEPGKLSTKVVEKEVPEPAAGDVLIKLYVRTVAVDLIWYLTRNADLKQRTHSGVCHSDFGIMTNSWKHLPLPTEKDQV